MKPKVYSLVLLTLALFVQMPAAIRAEENTAMVGVDSEQLFAGAWFTLTPQLNMMVSLYENSKIGWGIDYQKNGKTFKISSQWQEYEALFKTADGSLRYTRDDAAETAAGVVTWNYRDLGVMGYYSRSDASYASGALNAVWNGKLWQSSLHGAYRDDDGEQQHNYRLKNVFPTGNGKWSCELQANMFSEGSNYLIGEGAELAWTSAAEHWRMALGRFHETASGLTEDRLQLQWQDRDEKKFDWSTLGLDTAIAANFYGNDDSQQIGGVSAWWRRDFGHGSLKWDLENIWRAGVTPFKFDYEDEYSFYSEVAFDWQNTCHSNFSIKYDILKGQWRKVHGLLEVPVRAWLGSLTANYDLGADYDDSDLVYLFLLSSPTKNFSLSQSLNYNLQNLNTYLEWKIPFASGDGFRVKFSYDWEDKEFDDLLLEYSAKGSGTFTLVYDWDKPKIKLVYTWE